MFNLFILLCKPTKQQIFPLKMILVLIANDESIILTSLSRKQGKTLKFCWQVDKAKAGKSSTN